MATIIKGDAELRRKLAKITNPRAIVPGVKAAATHLRGMVTKYPPSTAANSPGGPGSRWYQRGWGSKWMRKDGSAGGIQNSEDLGPSWTRRIEKEGLRFIIGNDTSYAKYVQGPDDQAKAMKRIGWKDTDTIAKEEEETVLNFVKAQVDKILRGQ